MERRVHGKPTICLVITSPESLDFCMLPADDFDEWKRALKLIGSVSTLHTPNTVAGSQRTVVVGEPVASWPPEDSRTWSPESALRAVAAEAAALAATDRDGPEVRRVVAASDKATALMASSEGVMDRATMPASPTVLLMGWGLAEYPVLLGSETWKQMFFVLRESTEEESAETGGSTHVLVAYKTDRDARVAG